MGAQALGRGGRAVTAVVIALIGVCIAALAVLSL
jgi:hypothetical protein